MKTHLKILSLATFLASCTTTGHNVEVIERSDNKSARPDWADIEQVKSTSNGKHYFVSTFTADGDDVSPSAALNASDEKAKSEPMLGLVDSFLDQNQVGESLRTSDAVAQRIISATKSYRPAMPTLEIASRYYEKVAITSPNGGVRYETRAFSRAVVSVDDYERAKRDYLSHLKGDPEVKNILRDVGQKQRDAALNPAGSSNDEGK